MNPFLRPLPYPLSVPVHPIPGENPMRHLSLALAAMLAVSVTPTHAALNDTGQTDCYDASNAVAPDCATVAADDGDRPRQDARFGRDPAFAAGEFTKTGAGAAGFDFTKICMSGEAAGTGACPADPSSVDPSNPGANEWACTRDNHTNLVWSIETISNTDWTDATTTHPTSYDSATRCGFNSEWRAPARRELLSIVHHGASSPAIDTDFFPNTVSDWYWSSDEYAPVPANAWNVSFNNGYAYASNKSGTDQVRLVRSGQ
jgi:hypothetical protein